jgi:hypothetical protein
MTTEMLVLPQDHFAKRVKAQYSSIEEALVREVLQNSLDAGATRVDFTVERDRFSDETVWSASDNGQGMNLAEFRAFFLTLGGTHKETQSIGGFGAAKEILAFAWENWWARGQDFLCNGNGAANPTSEFSPEQPVGFSIGGHGCLMKSYDIKNAVRNVVKYCIGMKMKVFLNDDEVKPLSCRLKALESFPFGTMFFAGMKASGEFGDAGYAIVTHGNLYSCKHYIGGMRFYHLSINKELGPTEVFTESRDDLLWSIKSRVNMAAESMKLSAQERHDDPTCRIFVLPTGTGKTVEMDSTSSNVLEQIPFVGSYSGDRVITSEPVTRELKRDGFTITAEENKSGLPFQFAILRKPGARKRVGENASDLTEPDKKAITTTHITLNVIAKALNKKVPITGILFGKEAGCHCKVTPESRVIAINPKSVWSGPVNLVDTIIHEFVHDTAWSHGADFETVRSGYVSNLGLKYIKLLMEVASLYKDMGIKVK